MSLHYHADKKSSYILTQNLELMSCPYCGSNNLIWDVKSGTVVCMECASVVDVIYDDKEFSSTDIIIDLNKITINDVTRKFLVDLNKIQKTKTKYKINNSNTSKYISEDGILALEFLKMDPKVEKIYNSLTEKGFFSGKKLKTRVAISFYLAGYRGKRINNILAKLRINHKYFKKLIYKLPKELKYKIEVAH